jgi:hypothetical protein
MFLTNSLGAPASRRPVSLSNTPAGRQRSRQRMRRYMGSFVKGIIPQKTAGWFKAFSRLALAE